jgi:hypothetical protein
MKVTVEVQGSFYGHDWTMEQILAQAKREALGNLREQAKRGGLTMLGEPAITVHAFTGEL